MQYELKGFKELDRKLADLTNLQKLASPLRDNGEMVVQEMSLYPPQRPNQSYVRTLMLGRTWKAGPVQRVLDGLQIIVGNGMPYVKWVQASLTQAWMHRGRWQTEIEVLERLADKMNRNILRAVEKLMGK